ITCSPARGRIVTPAAISLPGSARSDAKTWRVLMTSLPAGGRRWRRDLGLRDSPTPPGLPAPRSSPVRRRDYAPPGRMPTGGKIVAEEVNPVAFVAFLALVGITLWATGHLIV